MVNVVEKIINPFNKAKEIGGSVASTDCAGTTTENTTTALYTHIPMSLLSFKATM